MSLNPKLILQPIHNTTADILKCFSLGVPLSCDQLNFVASHQHQLSSHEFDPVYQYYIESAKNKHKNSGSFLLSSELLTTESMKKLKQRLSLFLQKKSSHVLIGLTHDQFLKFRELNINELIFWHGNQYLTGAPFFPGGLPPVIYFQWGNLFGILLHTFSANALELKPKAIIHFEDRFERNLEQCVDDYQKTMKNELKLQQTILNENKIEAPLFDHFIIKTPMLTLDPMKKLYVG